MITLFIKQVLIVEDEPDLLWMLQRNLAKDLKHVEVLAVTSAEDALTILQTRPIHLVITDISLPGMSGLDLLDTLRRTYPETGVIVMTGYPTSLNETRALLSGSIRFLEKPFDLQELRIVVREFFSSFTSFQGIIEGIDLMDMVQFNGIIRATSILKVRCIDSEGSIFFKDGQIVHAMHNHDIGEKALYALFNFSSGSLQNTHGVEPPLISIRKPLESLLFEAARQSDEGAERDSPPQQANEKATSVVLDIHTFSEHDPSYPRREEIHTSLRSMHNSQPITIPLNRKADQDRFHEHITWALDALASIAGVETVCLCQPNGKVYNGFILGELENNKLIASAVAIVDIAQRLEEQHDFGEARLSILEFSRRVLCLVPIAVGVVLAVLADQETDLETIRDTIRVEVGKLRQVTQSIAKQVVKEQGV